MERLQLGRMFFNVQAQELGSDKEQAASSVAFLVSLHPLGSRKDTVCGLWGLKLVYSSPREDSRSGLRLKLGDGP